MRERVFVWRDHFIGYDTSPEIDAHFLARLVDKFQEWRELAGLHPRFRIGSVSGADLGRVALVMASLHMKHVVFCMEYIKRFPGKELINVLTIWDEKQKLIDAIASFGRMPKAVVYQCLRMLALDNRNVAHHAQPITPAYPSLIEATRCLWIRSVASAFMNPLPFAARELRRTYRGAWDASLGYREEWFREDLYALFLGNRYIRVDGNRELRESRATVTDVDAAILDVETRMLALFELKWQEPFGDDEAERRSRAKNLRDGIEKWVAVVQGLLARDGVQQLARQLGFSEREAARIKHVRLFVLARFHARFSGFQLTHPDAAVGTWAHFTRVRLEHGSVDDTFGLLFSELRRDEVPPRFGTPQRVHFKLGGIDVVADGVYETQA
jgi:hypothetical protein